MQYANLEQYLFALTIDVDALDRRKAVRSGGTQDCECNHPLAESVFQIDKRFRVTVHGAES